MAQPPAYNRQFSFTSYQTSNPTTPLPGQEVDIELNAIKQSLDAIEANLKLLQNDDGTLANLSVGTNQLSSTLTAGFSGPKAWLTGTAYTASPASTVFNSSKIYICLISHTSGTFATDLAAGKWQLILDLTTITIGAASQVSFTPGGGLASTDVQDALVELGNGKAATSHTHVAANISDSTSAGRALLTAANLAAQQTLLGLGSLAFLNSLTITSIPTQLALSGVISPAALTTNTNDWSPTNLATSTRIRVSSTSGINITGIAAQPDGTIITLSNIGSNTITLTNDDGATSSAANRFKMPYTGGYQLKANQSVLLQYDGTTARWRLHGWQRPEITAPNVQIFTSGTAQTYTTPTDANGNLPLYVRVRMLAGGGGGAAVVTNSGSNGGDSSFGSWTAIHGNGAAVNGPAGAGGTGGANSTGTLIRRIPGGNGGWAGSTAGSANMGGGTALSPATVTPGNTTTTAGATNTGAGGAGGTGNPNNGYGGGGGEYVEFIVPTPASSYTYTVGGGGNGGAAGTQAGGAGAAGRIEVEAFWQ